MDEFGTFKISREDKPGEVIFSYEIDPPDATKFLITLRLFRDIEHPLMSYDLGIITFSEDMRFRVIGYEASREALILERIQGGTTESSAMMHYL